LVTFSFFNFEYLLNLEVFLNRTLPQKARRPQRNADAVLQATKNTSQQGASSCFFGFRYNS